MRGKGSDYLFLAVAVNAVVVAISFSSSALDGNIQSSFSSHTQYFSTGLIHRGSTPLFSSTKTFENSEKKGDSTKLKVAEDALLKIMERQRAELQDTENLLQRLTEKGSNITDIINPMNADGEINTTSIVASIFSGVDYGFISRSEGCRFDLEGGYIDTKETLNRKPFDGYGPPASVFSLGVQQFRRNLDAIKGEYKDEEDIKLTSEQKVLRKKLKQLTLNSTAIWERERSRGPIEAPIIIKIPYLVLCYLLDVVFEGRYVPGRFFLLETVARMPYFSYITMLHFYETLGFWRRSSDVKRVHFAEEWNEYHHLLIMESLGGDQKWWVRFLAQHSALVYFVVLTALWALSPSLSYKFSELLETHAVDTYGQFIDENEKLLKELPPSIAAVEYYAIGVSDPMFGEYQTSALLSGGKIRKPGASMRSLYQVFSAIRADEGDHVSTMKACLDPNTAVLSPSLEKRVLIGVAVAATLGYFTSTGGLIDITSISDVTESLGSAGTELSNLADVAGEVKEGVDDTAVADTVTDGILGGIVAVLNELRSGEEENGASEVSDLIESGRMSALTTQLKKGFIEFLKAIGLLEIL